MMALTKSPLRLSQLYPFKLQEPEPNLVHAMMDFPRLAATLEHMTTHMPWALQALDGQEWYQDEFLALRGRHMLIKDLRTCNLDQIKLVLAHFPHMAVGARVPEPHHPGARHKLLRLAELTHSVTLMHEKPDGSAVVHHANCVR